MENHFFRGPLRHLFSEKKSRLSLVPHGYFPEGPKRQHPRPKEKRRAGSGRRAPLTVKPGPLKEAFVKAGST